MEETYCPDCKESTELVEDHSAGDTICSKCGLVLENYTIDDSPPSGSVVEPSSSDDRGCYSFGRTSLILRLDSHLAMADPPTSQQLTMADPSPSRRTMTDPPTLVPEYISEKSLNTARKTNYAELQTKENFFKLHSGVNFTETYSDIKAARNYVQDMVCKYECSTYSWKDEVIMCLKMQLAAYELMNGKNDNCEKLLQEGKIFLDTTGDINPYIYETYYKLALEYHKSCHEFSKVYMYSLLYLSCRSMESLTETSKLAMAFDLSVSALIGDDIYVFEELLSQPIIRRLPGTKLEWLYSYVMAFSAGDKGRYEELNVHEDAMLWKPPLVTHRDRLLNKINILSLKEIIYRRRSEGTVQMKFIAEQLNVSLEDVKSLLIKSMSVGLVQVKLNLAEGNVNVSDIDQGLMARKA